MNYQNGKIYKITNCIDDEVYVGSTCAPLSKRLSKHISDINSKTAFMPLYQHIKKLGKDKFCISLIEDYPCSNKTELNCREGVFIREQGTLNKNIAGRTHKEWVEENSELKKSIDKRNYLKNQDYKIEQQRKWYKENSEAECQKRKEYREKNKEYIYEKLECDVCKGFVSRYHMSKHQQTKTCKSFTIGNIGQ